MLSSVQLTISLLQVMAWRRIGHKPLSHYMNQWRLSLMTHTHIHIYIWNKVNIWNVNCARATASIFDTWTDVLAKVSKFLRQKMSRPEGGTRTPNLRIHAECSNHLNYQGQRFAVPIYFTPRVDSSPSVLITLQQVVGPPKLYIYIYIYIFVPWTWPVLTCVT